MALAYIEIKHFHTYISIYAEYECIDNNLLTYKSHIWKPDIGAFI